MALPVALVNVEICFDFVQYRALHVEELSVRQLCVWTDDMHDEPFLVLPCQDGCLPVFDLLLHSCFVRFVILYGCRSYIITLIEI